MEVSALATRPAVPVLGVVAPLEVVAFVDVVDEIEIPRLVIRDADGPAKERLVGKEGIFSDDNWVGRTLGQGTILPHVPLREVGVERGLLAEEDDLCAGTPLDAPFDDNGCSGEQRVELECGSPEDYSWRRSGRYIKCVVKESRAAKRAGLITKRERAWLIKRATIEMWLQRWTSRLRRWC